MWNELGGKETRKKNTSQEQGEISQKCLRENLINWQLQTFSLSRQVTALCIGKKQKNKCQKLIFILASFIYFRVWKSFLPVWFEKRGKGISQWRRTARKWKFSIFFFFFFFFFFRALGLMLMEWWVSINGTLLQLYREIKHFRASSRTPLHHRQMQLTDNNNRAGAVSFSLSTSISRWIFKGTLAQCRTGRLPSTFQWECRCAGCNPWVFL